MVEYASLAALKSRKISLLKEKAKLLREFGLLRYRPHAKQSKFHEAAAFKRRLMRAGNRFGKSQMGCAEDSSFLLGNRPWYPKDSPFRTLGIPQHPCKGLVITTDFDKVDEVWTSQSAQPGKIWQFLPNGFVKSTSKNSSGVIDTINCVNKACLRFDTVRSWQNNPQSSESTDWDFIHVDEPCPEKMWTAASRGLIDRGGPAWFTLTPLREVWINDMFFPRRYQDSPDVEVQKGSRWAMQGSMRDNPYLSAEAIAEFEQDLTDEEKQCRIEGYPLELSGLVYKEFSFDRHVLKELPKGWTAYNKPPRDYTIYYAIDPHPQTPHAVLFCAVSPLGQKFFWSEIFLHCVISDLAKTILSRLGGYYVRVAKCDPLAYINDPISGSNIEEELANNGVIVEKATKALALGILKVKEELKKENNLYFSPDLEETLWEFERYVWDENTNKPKDENDHMMENLYRLLLDNPRWYPVPKASDNFPIEDEEFSSAQTSMKDLELTLD
jgi:hypothetical protein